MSHCTTVQGPDILRNVIVSGYVAFYQICKFFVNMLFFKYCQMSLRLVEIASRAGFGRRSAGRSLETPS